MTTLYAQPYDVSATGFYFDSIEDYEHKSAELVNHYGQPVEEFEIQFVEGDELDAQLAEAINVNQANQAKFFELVETLDEHKKITLIIAVGECGYSFDPDSTSPDDFDLDLYEMDSMRALAEHFVDEGLMGEIPERLLMYFDYDALARDLAIEYSEISIAGKNYVFKIS